MTKYDKVRPLALAIIQHDDHIFVAEGYDKITQETYYRPLGGKIEFGEYGIQTVAREIHEEIHEMIQDVRYVGTIESIFAYQNNSGHEIVLFYTARFSNPALYDLSIQLRAEEEETDELLFIATWQPLAKFRDGESILYPKGLLEMIESV
jgi:ADP-ribose pyrophosphatase YjhB (NUDIX family)